MEPALTNTASLPYNPIRMRPLKLTRPIPFPLSKSPLNWWVKGKRDQFLTFSTRNSQYNGPRPWPWGLSPRLPCRFGHGTNASPLLKPSLSRLRLHVPCLWWRLRRNKLGGLSFCGSAQTSGAMPLSKSRGRPMPSPFAP